MGPRCHYSTTVEVAYYLQPLPRPVPIAPGLTRRVIIPEPSFWEPQTPFLYHGFVHLEDDPCSESPYPIQHGLRALVLRPQGLRLNGQPFWIRGSSRHQIAEPDARLLRQAGINTLLAPVSAASARLWEDADRLGFFVIGELTTEASSVAQALVLRGHACCLAWILPPEWIAQEVGADPALARLASASDPLFGVRLTEAPPHPLPQWVSFVVVPRSSLLALTDVRLPRLVLQDEGRQDSNETLPAAGSPAQLGWITE